jgi:hemolysin activation/secretion protein
MQNNKKLDDAIPDWSIVYSYMVVALLMVQVGFAQAGTIATDSGTLLKQTQPSIPTAPSNTDTGFTEQSSEERVDATSFFVATIKIVGNTLFDNNSLHNLVKVSEGSNMTLSQIQTLCDIITQYYRQHGYMLSRAVVPQQEINSGELNILVIEAHLGEVQVNNTSRVNGSLIDTTLSRLQKGEIIEQAEFDRALLLLSDIPGVNTSASFTPGRSVGTSNLIVNTESEPFFSGVATVDDFGNKFTDRLRAGVTASLVNPLRRGDDLSVNLVTTGQSMQYGRIDYSLLLNGSGTRLGSSYLALHYKLGDDIANLKANGRAQAGSVWVRHPLIRTVTANLYGSIQYEYTQLKDRIDIITVQNDRHVNSWSASLSGDRRDLFLGGGVNSWNASYSLGQVNYDNQVAESTDRTSAHTQGAFSKWSLNANRLQRINDRTNFWGSINMQIASDNLDTSQKVVVGGPFSVRAYDTGTIAGDNVYQSTVELRRELGNYYGQLQAIVFADYAHVDVNRHLWASATGENKANLAGVGVGVNWSNKRQWHIKSYAATSVGPSSTLTSGSDKTIVWFEIGKAF